MKRASLWPQHPPCTRGLTEAAIREASSAPRAPESRKVGSLPASPGCAAPDLPAALLLACAFLALASAIELALRGRKAWRWKGSLILIGCALLGAGCGTLIDVLHVRLSPDYFVHGKGLAPGPGLHAAAATLGARAGTGAGVLVGVVLTYCARPARERAPLPLTRVARIALQPLAYAACGGLLGLALGFGPMPVRWIGGYATRVDAASRSAFLAVWAAHLGLYLGLGLGTLRALASLRRVQRSTI